MALQSCNATEFFNELLNLNKPPEAISSAKEALRLDPDSAEAYLLLGCALHYDSETFAEAAAVYQKALQLQPDQFIALET
jgi:Flp pilus assembly protein TadD